MTTNRRRRTTKPVLPVSVTFEGGESVPILFANHIFVRVGTDGFLVSFAQSHGPFIVNPTKADLLKTGVPAKIVTRLAIPPARMRAMVDILNKMLEQYDATIGDSPEESG